VTTNPEVELTEHTFEGLYPWHKYVPQMDALRDAAIARGFDPDLARYLSQTATMQRSVMEHNAHRIGREPLAYGSFEEFVLAHGQSFTPPPAKHPRPKGFRKGRNRLCFMNATHATLGWNEREGWRYVEGFATGFITCHHAWALDGDGHVVETTWKDSGSAYAGIAFPHEVVRDAINLKGTYGLLGQALLEKPYDPEHPEAFIERLKAKSQRERRW
jgi:hypothetical protein